MSTPIDSLPKAPREHRATVAPAERPTDDPGHPAAAGGAGARPAAPALPRGPLCVRWSSATLLGDRDEVIIEHRGREYRLRITQSGKLT